MKCYNMRCKERDICDKYRYAACLQRTTEEQFELLKKINKYTTCSECGAPLLHGRLSKTRKSINICTNCMKINDIKRLLVV